jgi:hypothetical protein
MSCSYYTRSYLAIYAAAEALGVVADSLASVIWAFGGMRASRIIHGLLVDSVLGATFRCLLQFAQVMYGEVTDLTDGLIPFRWPESSLGSLRSVE